MIPDKIYSILKESKSIVILPHVSADGDALGSSLALGMVLMKIGKQVTVYLEEEIPYIYEFIPGKEIAKVYEGKLERFDVAVILDTGDMERLGKRQEVFKNSTITINIDHHNTNTEFAFYNYVQTSSSAVGEIIYQMINTMNLSIDRDTAVCLYIAIATDTGGFRFSNTTEVTHQIIGDLINKGVNVSEISQKIFDNTSLEKVRLTGLAISSLEILERGKIAFISISDDVIRGQGAREEDCEGIVNIGRNIIGVEVSVMLRERNNGEIKANLRSKNYVDVSALAGMFRGGGHKRAAGFSVQGKIEDVKKQLLKDIKEVL
jgi:bifunctional oligoribonuclease and PAP phosphatase NrnA